MKKYSIDVNVTEEDLYDLGNGKEFDWNWITNENKNVQINIRLYKTEDDLGE